ncbi:MAG: hypothetical protein IIB00_08985 [candidate division Zixibacteria bacterium]|nr:hypothetical protein [candidate division Zixibacteria bacterium]
MSDGVSMRIVSHNSLSVSAEMNQELSAKNNSYITAYAVFLGFALAYFWYYLPQDFSYTDEGYLLGLGHRMALGQLIYVDFNFLRPPLSPIIQAVFIKTFGSGYTVLWSKIYWAIQATATVIIASYIYREWMSRPLFTITLIATLLYSTLLFAFPWYTYDGMFFASLFVLSVFRTRFLLAGVFAGLAFLCKQGFLALLPLTFGFLFVLTLFETGNWKLQTRNLLRATLGWGIPVAICSIAFLMYGAFDEMITNIFILPQRVNLTSLNFILFQDLPIVVTNFAVPALIVLGLYLLRSFVVIRLVLILALAISLSDTMLNSKNDLPQFMITTIYLVSFLSLFENLRKIRQKKCDQLTLRNHTLALALGITLLYVASINYCGVVFSYVGGVVALPMLFVVLSNSIGPIANEFRSAERTMLETFLKKGLIPYLVALGVLTLCFLAHHKFPYSRGPRSALSSEFATPKLAGIRGRSSIVVTIDSLVNYILVNTSDRDSIFTFPALTSLCYLTDRPAWGRTHWSYYREYDTIMAKHTVSRLLSAPPSLVILENPDSSSLVWEAVRKNKVIEAVVENFKLVDSVVGFMCYRPAKREAENRENIAGDTN